MLRDADPESFKTIYIICGRTDLCYGIDSLAAMIESRYNLPLFIPGTLFLFCGKRSNKIKGLVFSYSSIKATLLITEASSFTSKGL